ncbi:hypothetical protein G4D82_13960 [Flavobacterium sp. CYK-4]|uniref:hypothetical protein n=1 Tax=Flavobacterium lotistagni TaxID=2709660 RepID=UPI00140D0CED|nr:hypothetical protein [Flavobacterium lotistagni]NHM08329.1 hypothetical protein [Flavobacterium lotistagni]
MTKSSDILLDKEIRTGGFYELAIQVCHSIDNEPIRHYTEFIWSLENVIGPFDVNNNPIPVDIANIQHIGVLQLENYAIPFMTYNIREEEPIETGFNWFDICFYATAIEKVFGAEYQTWTENPKVPEQLKMFFAKTLKELYKIYPFQLAILDYEVSGQYYLDNLKTPLTYGWTPSSFFVGKDNYKHISKDNRKFVSIIEDIFNE